MLRWFRRQRALAVAATLAALLAWLGASWAQATHELTAVHEICADHGEIVEAGADADDDGDAPAGEHQHGCEAGGLVTHASAELPSITAEGVPWSSQHPPVLLLASQLAPRGPPLRYAPKTSPPSLLG